MGKTIAIGFSIGFLIVVLAVLLSWKALLIPVGIFILLAPFATSRKGDRDYRYDE